jgi:hypothetical protein
MSVINSNIYYWVDWYSFLIVIAQKTYLKEANTTFSGTNYSF